MNLDDFLARLEGVRRSGHGHIALCPAHDDSSPSLSIGASDDGILVNCQAGCSTESVIAAMGLTWPDLFFATRSYSEPEATYDYVDETGALLFQVLRFPGKKFRQRHTDPETDEVVWNLDGVRRVLYRLPEVLDAVRQEQTVYITEGEKDVESLRSIGKVATCCSGGSSGWRPEYAQALSGAYVIVVADRDEPGRKYAEAIQQSLVGVAKSVHVFQAKEGKDVTDHLEAGHALEHLIPLNPANKQRHYQPLDLFVPVPPVAWVIENVVVAGEATLLIADGGAGKSFFALAASLAVAGGQPFLGCDVQRGRVIYVDEEGSHDLALQRLWQLGATDEQKKNIDYLNFAGVDMVRYPERLIEDALIAKPKLIVIDSHAKVTRVGEENSNNEMGVAWDDGFLPLARKTGAAVLVIHHTNNYGSSRGATQIRNSADQVLTMKKQEDGSQIVYASKPRRLTNKLHFQFVEQGFGRYGLVAAPDTGWNAWSAA